ncbi:MAG: hypothetical protein SGARI_001310 [Bacillariaceae sp.]
MADKSSSVIIDERAIASIRSLVKRNAISWEQLIMSSLQLARMKNQEVEWKVFVSQTAILPPETSDMAFQVMPDKKIHKVKTFVKDVSWRCLVCKSELSQKKNRTRHLRVVHSWKPENIKKYLELEKNIEGTHSVKKRKLESTGMDTGKNEVAAEIMIIDSASDDETPDLSKIFPPIAMPEPPSESASASSTPMTFFSEPKRMRSGRAPNGKRAVYLREQVMPKFYERRLLSFIHLNGQRWHPQKISQTLTTLGRLFGLGIETYRLAQNEKEFETLTKGENSVFCFTTFAERALLDVELIISYLEEARDVAEFKGKSLVNELDRIRNVVDSLSRTLSSNRVLFEKAAFHRETLTNLRMRYVRIQEEEHSEMEIEDLIAINEWAKLSELRSVIESDRSKMEEALSSKETLKHRIQYVRGFLLNYWFIESRPQRPGFLKPLKVREWRAAVEKGYLQSTNFKTSSKYGYLTLTIPEGLAGMVEKWIRLQELREWDTVFAYAGSAIIFYWEKRLGRHLTCNRLRSIVVTEAMKILPENEMKEIAQGSYQTLGVADRYYKKISSLEQCKKADSVYKKLQDSTQNSTDTN